MADITITVSGMGIPILPTFLTYRDGGSTGFPFEGESYLLENGMHNRDVLYAAPYILRPGSEGGRRTLTEQEASRLKEVLPNWIDKMTADSKSNKWHINALRVCLTRLENYLTIYSVQMGPIL